MGAREDTHQGLSGCHILHSGNSAWPQQFSSCGKGKGADWQIPAARGLRDAKDEDTNIGLLLRLERGAFTYFLELDKRNLLGEPIQTKD